ncbi:phage tail assembly chaperone G [Bacillus sp. G1(2015b)]|uniref:phage tail assembly chaperone G n=1 Tax=Bacillus sp. G1(2015b) TaxID=1706732 RepID=UPI000738A991|nr:hypothetical protein [Bacillus sp. G1(2015b)]KUF22016.1 hypothetical protein AMR95_14870 [Bacillus sp. G1(2015b)]
MIKLVLKDYSKAKFDEEGNITEVPEKTYKQYLVTARKLRKMLELYSQEDEKTELQLMDGVLDYIVELFDDQFKVDDILNGVEASELSVFLEDVMAQLTQGDQKKAKLKEKALKAQKA